MNMELLCIQTHSKGAVVAGNIYPLISDERPCGCRNCVNVGIEFLPERKGEPGTAVHGCGHIYIHDGFWWIRKELFAPIASETELQEQVEEKQLQNA